MREDFKTYYRCKWTILQCRKCPLYEEVLDTQMFGLSREVDFAVRLGLIAEEQGKAMLDEA